jgi:Spy/CpxP family protein refolding chaperone
MGKTWIVVLAFVGIFMAGTVTGSMIALSVAAKLQPQRPPSAVLNQFGVMQMQGLVRRLGLTDDQKKKIEPIVQKSADELRRLSGDTQHQTRDIIIRMHDEVSALLTPEQKQKFIQMQSQWQKRMNEQFPDHGRRQGGPQNMGGWSGGPGGMGQGPRPMPPPATPPGAADPPLQPAAGGAK